MHSDTASQAADAVLTQAAEGGVLHLTLNRPKALNAFNRALFDALREALTAAAHDDEVRCVLLTGEGRAFSAGSDLAGDDDAGGPDPWPPFIEALESFPKPLVAAVNGLAVGVGATMLGHCDLVLAGTAARFRYPFTSLGLVPEAGSTVTLPAMIGRQAAAHALFTSEWVSSAEAERLGLVWKLASDEELATEAAAVCAAIAAQPLESLVATKDLLLAGRLPAITEARRREEPEFVRLLAGPAHAAAVAAFRSR